MKRILLVDYLCACFVHYHAKEANLPLSFTRNLREIVRAYKVDRTLLLREGGSVYRSTLLPTYKSARKERREKQSDAEKAAYDRFLADTEALSGVLQLLGCRSLKLFGAEADDLAGYLCAVLPPEDYQLLLLTEDSDWSQLLSRPNTVIGSYREMVKGLPELPGSLWLNYGSFTGKKGLTPLQWFDKKMLTGDTSDSIPGIYGLGDAGATRLLERYGSLDNIRANVDNLEIPRLSARAKEGLKEGDDLLNLGYRLMNLRWSEEEWEQILDQEGKHYLPREALLLDNPPSVDSEAFTEFCYVQGWIDCLDPQWLAPFQKNIST